MMYRIRKNLRSNNAHSDFCSLELVVYSYHVNLVNPVYFFETA
jgi:hypothetical protein